MSEGIRAAIAQLDKTPCTCVYCATCGGTGNIAVNYDALGRIESEGMFDDCFDLEPCDQCHGGIAEECQRCSEIGELYEMLDEEEWKSAKAKDSAGAKL